MITRIQVRTPPDDGDSEFLAKTLKKKKLKPQEQDLSNSHANRTIEKERKKEPEDWLNTIKLFMSRPDCDRSIYCGRKHPIWFAAQLNMPFKIAR